MLNQSNQFGIISDITGDNIINANLLGYTSRFGNQTPLDLVAYSLFQGQYPQGVGEVGTVDYGKEKEEKTEEDIKFEERLRRLIGIINPIGSGIEAANEIIKTKDEDSKEEACKGYSNDNLLSIPFRTICESSVDIGKRFSLGIVAVLLIALGIWKLT